LQRNGQVVFSFDASAGDRLTITVDATFNLYLSLRDEHGAEIAADGDANAQAGLLDIELAAKGAYFIVVTGATNSEQGSFNLMLTKR
jgi:hypothetical protein